VLSIFNPRILRSFEEHMSWVQWVTVLKLTLLWKMNQIQDVALQKIRGLSQNSHQWIAALKIATELRMHGLREIAIQELNEDLDPLQKIDLATKYSVRPWLIDGYFELVMRKEGIKKEEEQCLGPSRTANLFRVRHQRIEAGNSIEVVSTIETTFQREFIEIKAFNNAASVSYLCPDLHTATDSDAIQRDSVFYFEDIIFKLSFSPSF
jgi:ribosomal protein S13